ncbi:quinoprotein dehydrogenase-associated SoxYZ-like carrier [Rhodopila sp.]|uniref:quinoprotein dehydrogenase-associated SoxYZ-like carrier n=1 Tax=Rhodopila sp. TaxID=2480087 RepID=UPI003D12C309
MRALRLLSRRYAMAATLATGAFGRLAQAQGETGENPWPALAGQIFSDRPIEDGSAVLAVDAPYRAEDAAVVPISIHSLLSADDKPQIRSVTLVVDQNPAPVAAKFSLGQDSGVKNLSTRIRVDSYTKLHAVAEMTDGRFFAAERFVKAAGGCSAPAAKQEGDAIPLGTMRLRQFPQATDAASRQIQFMIRHPNNSGMQMDQLTRLYVPAHFVSSISIWQGDDLLLGIESGISISENPEFRFEYRPNGATEFRAEARDNEGSVFKQSWSATRA